MSVIQPLPLIACKLQGSGFRVSGFGFRFRASGLGLRVYVLGFSASDVGLKAAGFGRRVWGLIFRLLSATGRIGKSSVHLLVCESLESGWREND